MSTFTDLWSEAIERKNSVLCAGFDPVFESMLTDKERAKGVPALPDNTDKYEWAMNYLQDIAFWSCAIKLNGQFWKGIGDEDTYIGIANEARSKGLLVIDDSKLADIGATNRAGIYAAKQRKAHAVTIAPFAGNLKEAADQGRAYDIGTISMVLMSNPEFAREKNQLVQVNEDGSFHDEFSLNDVDFGSDGVARVPRYLSLARDAALAGIDAIVIGAPSSNNHISRSEIARVRSYAPTQRVLVPGVGKQGGDAASLWAIYGANDVIVNVGTALMFPQGKSRDRVAEQYCLELNAARHVSLGR